MSESEVSTLTEAERYFDRVVSEQRSKGREHYGSGLEWRDGAGEEPKHDWQRMALEEAVDLSQYLVAEMIRLEYENHNLKERIKWLGSLPASPSTFSEYQRLAMVTAPELESTAQSITIRTLGLAGEAGEVVEHVKKHLGHGHKLDVEKVAKELGDVLWYVATLCDALGLDMGNVASANIEKLKARYPEGFSAAASIHRVD